MRIYPEGSGMRDAPLPMLGMRCADCGYGARRQTEPERCPMCAGTAWALEGWQPFAELSRPLESTLPLHTATDGGPLTLEGNRPTLVLEGAGSAE